MLLLPFSVVLAVLLLVLPGCPALAVLLLLLIGRQVLLLPGTPVPRYTFHRTHAAGRTLLCARLGKALLSPHPPLRCAEPSTAFPFFSVNSGTLLVPGPRSLL